MKDATTYLVNELFLTIQGEASHAGTPAVFVRLQGCSVGCAFCDTKYTWPKDPKDERERLTILGKTEPDPTFTSYDTWSLIEQVRTMSRRARHVVLTGGEPADHDLLPLSRYLADSGFTVQVETSGTSPLSVDERAWVTLSPKIDMPAGKVVLEEVVRRANEIKHPTATPRHLLALQDLLRRGWHRSGIPVWLQPLSMHPVATARCVEWCHDFGYRLSIQTHRYIGAR